MKQYKLSYYKNLVIVFVIRKKSCDACGGLRLRFVYKSSRIQKWQKFSESDRTGVNCGIDSVTEGKQIIARLIAEDSECVDDFVIDAK
ncbi:hypothetical protein [Nostoc sp.]|uniref:hypothetical protein n=1 Tax=Nostoc sp. TaxID=1180 RepID=UPI002FF56674